MSIQTISLEEPIEQDRTVFEEALFNFVKELSFVEVNMGKERKEPDGSSVYTVGMLLGPKNGDMSSILSFEPISINNDIGTLEIVKEIIKNGDYSNELLSLFEKWTRLEIIPSVLDIGDKVSYNNVKCRVESIKYIYNKEIEDIKCIMTISAGYKNNFRVGFEEYGKNLFLPDIEVQNTAGLPAYRFIEMNSIGIIKPIEIVQGNNSVIIDGSFVYIRCGNEVSVVDRLWGEYTKVFKSVIKKYPTIGKVLSGLKNEIELIYRHRRLIAPYGLIEPNIIEGGGISWTV